jgi:hypothetical protein
MATWPGQAQAANLYSDKQSAVDASRSAHDLFQLISHPLRDIKPVFTSLTFLADRGAFRLFFWWLSSTAGYVHRQRGSTFVERHCFPQAGPLLWVLPVFIRAPRKTFVFPGRPFGLSAGRHNNCKPLCRCSLPEPHDSVRRSLRWSQRP